MCECMSIPVCVCVCEESGYINVCVVHENTLLYSFDRN